MIKLDVEPYCEDCPHFDAVTVKDMVGDMVVWTDVVCVHAAQCERVAKWVKMKGEA